MLYQAITTAVLVVGAWSLQRLRRELDAEVVVLRAATARFRGLAPAIGSGREAWADAVAHAAAVRAAVAALQAQPDQALSKLAPCST